MVVERPRETAQKLARKRWMPEGPGRRSIFDEAQTALQGALPEGAKLVDVEFALKGKARMLEKLAEVKEQYGLSSLAEGAGYINDAIRFTAVYGPAQYRAGIRETLDNLGRAGWRKYDEKFRNAWGQDGYKGINMVIEKGDVRMEVQFHTPQSAEAHNAHHDLYKGLRASKPGTPDWHKWESAIRNAWAGVAAPAGVGGWNGG